MFTEPKTPKTSKKKTNAALVREWEKRLKKEGMAAEPGKDKGAEALRKLHEAESEKTVSEQDIKQKIQDYWVFREGASFGHHREAAAAIADELGITADEVPEDLMKVVEEEVAAAEKEIRKIIFRAVEKSPSVRYRPDQLRKAIDADVREKFGDFSPMALEGIIQRASEF